MAWKDSMPISIWAQWTPEQQQDFLDANNIEVRGYTLIGSMSLPTAVEFGPCAPRVPCACPWCSQQAEPGCYSIFGQPTCKHHSAESVLEAIGNAIKAV